MQCNDSVMPLVCQVQKAHATMPRSHAPCSLCAAGQKLKQKKALVVPAAEALEVLEDEDLAAQAGASAKAAAAPQGTLRQRLDAGDLQEHLREDPLRLHKATPLHSSFPPAEHYQFILMNERRAAFYSCLLPWALQVMRDVVPRLAASLMA